MYVYKILERRADKSKVVGVMDKVLFIDTCIGLDHALGIAKKYEVWFAVVHSRAFPRLEDEINGYGFEEIRKVWDWAEGLDNGCNVVVFADSGFGHLADYLRKDGYAVFGSDAKTELMELDRAYFKKVCREYGIPTPSYDIARGIDEVRRIIEEKGKRFIKISRFRGSVETFATDSPEEAEEKLRGSELAMFANDLEFVLEEPMDKDNMVEVGVDAFFNGREFLDIVFNTIELKWSGNFAQASRLEESIWYDVLKKIEPFLVKNGYRGMIAFEGFFDGETVYVTDPTPRYPYVCSYAYPRMIRNYADVVVGVAKGEDVDIDLISEFSVQIPVYTDNDKEWREIESKNWEMTALRHSVKVGDRIMWVPVEDNVIATAIGLGGNIKEAIANAIEVVEGISALESYHRAYEFRQYFIETWRKLKEINDSGLKKGKITIEIGGEVSKQQESDVPPEHRLYIKPEDLSKLPKEIKVYRGPRGGLYIDRRELKRITGKEEIESLGRIDEDKSEERVVNVRISIVRDDALRKWFGEDVEIVKKLYDYGFVCDKIEKMDDGKIRIVSKYAFGIESDKFNEKLREIGENYREVLDESRVVEMFGVKFHPVIEKIWEVWGGKIKVVYKPEQERYVIEADNVDDVVRFLKEVGGEEKYFEDLVKIKESLSKVKEVSEIKLTDRQKEVYRKIVDMWVSSAWNSIVDMIRLFASLEVGRDVFEGVFAVDENYRAYVKEAPLFVKDAVKEIRKFLNENNCTIEDVVVVYEYIKRKSREKFLEKHPDGKAIVYRGVKKPFVYTPYGEHINWRKLIWLPAMSSWSESRNVAEKFGEFVYAMEVDVNDIIMYYEIDEKFRDYGEYEVVIMSKEPVVEAKLVRSGEVDEEESDW